MELAAIRHQRFDCVSRAINLPLDEAGAIDAALAGLAGVPLRPAFAALAALAALARQCQRLPAVAGTDAGTVMPRNERAAIERDDIKRAIGLGCSIGASDQWR